MLPRRCIVAPVLVGVVALVGSVVAWRVLPRYELRRLMRSTGAVVLQPDRGSLRLALRPVDTGQGLDPDEPLNRVESGR